MSRAYNSRRKARRQAQAEAESVRSKQGVARRVGLTPLVPVLLIVVVLAVVGIVGFGVGAGSSNAEVEREVTELLHGIPQRGTLLGSLTAPITLRVYGDLECPTVKLFVEDYLPAIISNWVRPGAVRLDFRSLETDTSDERLFFKQEVAALAAGKQNRMWNFILTFVRQQGEPRSGYVTSGFLSGIASQVPGLDSEKWQSGRADALLTQRVALGVHSGHVSGLRSTPSFVIEFTQGEVNEALDRASIAKELEASLGTDLEILKREASGDSPTLRVTHPTIVEG